jgi:hypothetical protein
MTDERCFHVTIKGLVFDEHGALMLLREKSGHFDLPGGRLEHGEEFGLSGTGMPRRNGRTLSGDRPTTRFAWTARDKNGVWRLVLCFAIELESLELNRVGGMRRLPVRRQRRAQLPVDRSAHEPLATWL